MKYAHSYSNTFVLSGFSGLKLMKTTAKRL